MSTSIPKHILGINAQVVNTIEEQESGGIIIVCNRDKHTRIIGLISKLKTTVNRYIRRRVKDLPLFGHPCIVEIELAQVNTHDGYSIVEDCITSRSLLIH